MKARVGWVALGLILGAGAGSPARAANVERLAFSERVRRAAIIVRGRVAKLEAFRRGAPVAGRAERAQKESRLPNPTSAERAEAQSGAMLEAPQELGTEGGSMIFTRVTLDVEEEVKGIGGRELVFEIAGGVLGGRAAIVHGMPTFEQGRRYMLFLRSGFENSGDPLVGVDQGFFEIVGDQALGADVLLDSKGDFVLGIENDQVVSRRNLERAKQPSPALGAAPMRDSAGGGKVAAELSPEVRRYWLSSEPAMSPQSFRQAILSVEGVRQ